jgi:hypothetical protein
MVGPQSVNVDRQTPGAGDSPSAAYAAASVAADQAESPGGIEVSLDSTSPQAPVGSIFAVAPQSLAGAPSEGEPVGLGAAVGLSGFTVPPATAAGVVPSAPPRDGNGGGAQKVFALGKLSFDYGTRAQILFRG